MVDAGRSKQKLLESGAGVARYEVRWVSKASAAQRAGRAGRTGPGQCYRCRRKAPPAVMDFNSDSSSDCRMPMEG